MNDGGVMTRAFRKIGRWVFLANIDTIAKVRKRHADFDTLRDRIRAMGTDSLAHFGNHYTFEGGLSLQQNPDELAALCLLLKERGPYNNYMEIGSASGGTCRFLFETVGFRNVLSLDDGSHPRASEQKDNFRVIPNFKQFLGDSHSEQARAFLAENLDGALDVAFIDGDHGFEGVWEDIRLTLPFCRRGTLVIFHDTRACEDVRKAWLKSVMRRQLKPLAEYVGEERPLGISINVVL
jgi:predicted O-methyltransferase YrrM